MISKLLYFSLFFPVIAFSQPSWDSKNTGNVFIPGYLADPSIIYDDHTDSFYVYATSDGTWISYSRDPHVAVSKDLVNWDFMPIELPSFYPISTPDKPNIRSAGVWAPTVFKHPTNGNYYLAYQIDACFYVMYSDSPLGEWKNATAGEYPLLHASEQWGKSDAFDGQFFVDKDSSVYVTFGGGGNMGICKTQFDDNGIISIDNSDLRFTDGDKVKYKRIKGLPQYLEGSLLLHDHGIYYLTYSCSASQDYHVRYATSSSPLGPFIPQEGSLVHRDNSQGILGPGHHDMFNFKGDWYIVYHRQHYPMVDAKRQTCIERVDISNGQISLGVQSHSGLSKGSGELEQIYQSAISKRVPPLSEGKASLASSISDYKGGVVRKENFEFSPKFYRSDYAFDNNYGTRWQSSDSVGVPAWLIVDLGKDFIVQNTELIFEYTIREYGYTLEYLSSKDAPSLHACSTSTLWKAYAKGESKSPARNKRRVKARYMKVSITNVILPRGADYRGCSGQDYENRPSIVEFYVYGDS